MEELYSLQRISPSFLGTTKIVLFNILFVFLFFLISLASPKLVCAGTELNVTMQVHDTTFIVTGRTSPNAKVTVLEDNSVIGTTLAGGDGSFSKEFPAQDTGVHNYGFYSTDSEGRDTSTINYSVSLFSHTVTTLSNLILPPTYELSATEITADEDLLVEGSAVPSSQVVLYFSKAGSSEISSHTVKAGSTGRWEYSLGLDSLGEGTYEIYGQVTTVDGYQSDAGSVLGFEVTAPPEEEEEEEELVSPPVSVEEEVAPSPTLVEEEEEEGPKLPDFMSVFDPDGDGRISKSEVFDAVKSWVHSWRDYLSDLVADEQLQEPPLEKRTCDLNNDGKCNLRDFSILLYYIEREEGG
ncbi:MAG: Ig-like domain-containing protein [Patescibacteria group bacterium]|nr:Ig-like domain-containing protein [Patescibacteria group bacterium]